MQTRRAGLLLLAGSLLLVGCGGGAGDATVEGVDLAGSRQGQAGGLVDVDGDGTDDKVVGAPGAQASSDTGIALVYKGTAEGFDLRPSVMLKGDDNFGGSFARLDDVDGDGMDDFAVGAMHGSGGPDEAGLSGTVSVFRGGSGGELLRRLAGEGPMDKFGYAVAGGDLDDDGHGEVIVGAPFQTPSAALFSQGAAYVYFGPDLSRSVALRATSAQKGLGWAVAAGDVNGDGVDDLLMSAAGKVLGYYGGASFAPATNAPDLVVTSAAAGFGRALAVLGDVDGDGFGDLAVGAPTTVVGGSRDTGCVFVIRGGAGSRTVDADASPPALLARICGAGLFDRFGSSLAAVGDRDGDGKPELAVGAPTADAGGNRLAGRVYLLKGADLGSADALARAVAFDGLVQDQGYGTSVSSLGDGRLLVGAPRSHGDTGGVALVDLATGQPVPGGSSGGSTGGSGDCH